LSWYGIIPAHFIGSPKGRKEGRKEGGREGGREGGKEGMGVAKEAGPGKTA